MIAADLSAIIDTRARTKVALRPYRHGPAVLADVEALAADLGQFVRAAWPLLEPTTRLVEGFFIDAIAAHLEAVTRGEIRNLLITIPPRFAKSTLVSVIWPAWEWIANPSARFLTASYAANLATRDAVRSRRLIMSPWFQARWGDRFRMTSDQNVKSRYENDRTGFRMATSVGGATTGEGGSRILVDDPHNVREAGSEARRLATLEWWDQAMSNRVNDPKTSARVIIQQRVHQQDLAGHVLAQGGWDHLNLPQEYEPATTRVTSIGWKDPRTEPGQLLSPARFGPAEVERSKRELGEYGYAAQHQQRPSPPEGGIFKQRWWRYWQPRGMALLPVSTLLPDGEVITCPVVDLPARFDEQLQSWDMTFTGTEAGSYVVGQVWGASGADAYLLDQFRDRVDFVGAVAAVRALTARWPACETKLVENKANGPAIVATLKHEIAGLIEAQPDGDKPARARAVSPRVESGNVYLPHPDVAPWVKAFVRECTDFPRGANNDQVDGMSQGLRGLTAHDIPIAVPSGYVRSSLFGRYDDDEV